MNTSVSLSIKWGTTLDLSPEAEKQGAWCAAVHGVAKSGTRLSNWTTTTKPDFAARSLAYLEATTTGKPVVLGQDLLFWPSMRASERGNVCQGAAWAAVDCWAIALLPLLLPREVGSGAVLLLTQEYDPPFIECQLGITYSLTFSRWFCNIHAATAAKSLQLCPTLCDPIDGSPPGSPIPGILQARTLEWVAISFSNAWKWKVKVKSLSRIRLLATPWTAAHQPPPSMGFSGKSTGVGCHCLLRRFTLLFIL